MNLQGKFKKIAVNLKVTQAGFCHAFSMKVIEAVLTGKFGELHTLVDDVKNLNENDAVKSFFESLYVYGQPRIKFPTKKYTKADFPQLSLLAGNQEIITQGGLTTVHCRTNCYDDEQLSAYLFSLETQLVNGPLHSTPILLSTTTHKAVAVFTPSASEPWQFIDINNYKTTRLNLNGLINNIKKGLVFSGTKNFHDYITFNAQIILTTQQESVLNWRQQLTIPLIPERIEKEKYSLRDGRYVIKAAYLAILYNEDNLFHQILEHSPLFFLENTIPTRAKKWSPLQLAAYLGKEDYVQTLRSNPKIKAELSESSSKYQTNFRNALALAKQEKYPDIVRILLNIPTKSNNQPAHIKNILGSLEGTSIESICLLLKRCIAYGPQSKLEQSELNAARSQILAHFTEYYSEKPAVISVIKTFFQMDNREILPLPEEARAIEKWITISLYPLARALIELEISLERDISFFAINLCLIFNSTITLLQYLGEFRQFNPVESTLSVLQDSCQFSIPNPNKVQFNFWKTIANKNKFMLTPTNRTILTRAEDLEGYHATLSADKGGKDNLDKLNQPSIIPVEVVAKLMPGESHQLGKKKFTALSENQLQKLFKLYIASTESLLLRYQIPIRYSAILHRLKPMNDDNSIPNIIINGADYGLPGIFASKLDITTFKGVQLAAMLGRLTHCCQSIDDAAKSSVRFAIENRNSGIYIVYKGTEPNNQPSPEDIIGQSWVWRDQDKFCFDSLETSRQNPLLSMFFFNLLAINLNGQYGINQITYGRGAHVGSSTRAAKPMISTDFLVRQGIYTDAKSTQYSMDLDSCHTNLYNLMTMILSRHDEEFLLQERFIRLVEMYIKSTKQNLCLTQAIIMISWLSMMWIKFPEFINLWTDQYKEQFLPMVHLLLAHRELHPISSSSWFFLQLLLDELKLNFLPIPALSPHITDSTNHFLTEITPCSKNIKYPLMERYMGKTTAELYDNNAVEQLDLYKINFTLLSNRIIENQEISNKMFEWFIYCHSKARYLPNRTIILDDLFLQSLEIIQEFKQIKDTISAEMLKSLETEPEIHCIPEGLLNELNTNPALKSTSVKLVLLQLGKIIHYQENHNQLSLPTYMISWLENIVVNQLIKTTELFFHIKKEHTFEAAVQIFSLIAKPIDFKFISSLLLEEKIYILKNIGLSQLLSVPAITLRNILIKCAISDQKAIILRYSKAYFIHEKEQNTTLEEYIFSKYLLSKFFSTIELLNQFIESSPEMELHSKSINEESNARLIESILAFQSGNFNLSDLTILEQFLNPFPLQTSIIQIITKAQLHTPEVVIALAHYLGVEQSRYLNLYNSAQSLLEWLFKNPDFFNLSNRRNLIRLFRSQESHAITLKQFCLKISNYESFILALNVLKELDPPGEFLTWLFDNQNTFTISRHTERYLTHLLLQLINYKSRTAHARNDSSLPYEEADFFDQLWSDKIWLTKLIKMRNIHDLPIIFNILEEVTYDYSNSLSNPHYTWWNALLALYQIADPEGITLQSCCINGTNANLSTSSTIRALNLLQDLLPYEQLKNLLTTMGNIYIRDHYFISLVENLQDYASRANEHLPDNPLYRNSFFDQIFSDYQFFISILFSIKSKSLLSERLRHFEFKSLITIAPEIWTYESLKAVGLLGKDIDFVMNFIFCLQINGLLSSELLASIVDHYSAFLKEKTAEILLILKCFSIEDSLKVIDSFPDNWHFTFSLALFHHTQFDVSKHMIAEFILRKNIPVYHESTNLSLNRCRCLFEFIQFVSNNINPRDLPVQHSFMKIFFHYLAIGSFENQDIRLKIQHWNFALTVCSPTDFDRYKTIINIRNVFMGNQKINPDEWKTLIRVLYNHYGKSASFLCTLTIYSLPPLMSFLIEDLALLEATKEAAEYNDEFERFVKHFQANPVIKGKPVSLFYYQYFTSKENIVWSLEKDIQDCIKLSGLSAEDLFNLPNASLTPQSRIRRWAYMINNPVADRIYPSSYFETLLSDSCNNDYSDEAYDLIDALLKDSKISNTIKNKILNSPLTHTNSVPARKNRMFSVFRKQLPVEIIDLINSYKNIQNDCSMAYSG